MFQYYGDSPLPPPRPPILILSILGCQFLLNRFSFGNAPWDPGYRHDTFKYTAQGSTNTPRPVGRFLSPIPTGSGVSARLFPPLFSLCSFFLFFFLFLSFPAANRADSDLLAIKWECLVSFRFLSVGFKKKQNPKAEAELFHPFKFSLLSPPCAKRGGRLNK